MKTTSIIKKSHFFAIATFFVLLSLSFKTKAQSTELRIPTISLDETAYIEVEPDIAIISVQVYLEGREAAEIEERAYQKAAAIVKVFKEKYDIKADDYETTQNTLNDQRWKNQPTKAITLGFEVTLKKLDKIDQFRNDVIEAGATVFRIQSFENKNAEKYVNQAAELALKKAMKNAANLAEIASMKLGNPLSIRVQNQSIRPEMISTKAAGGLMMMSDSSVQSRDDEPTVNKTKVRYRATIYAEFEMYK